MQWVCSGLRVLRKKLQVVARVRIMRQICTAIRRSSLHCGNCIAYNKAQTNKLCLRGGRAGPPGTGNSLAMFGCLLLLISDVSRPE